MPVPTTHRVPVDLASCLKVERQTGIPPTLKRRVFQDRAQDTSAGWRENIVQKLGIDLLECLQPGIPDQVRRLRAKNKRRSALLAGPLKSPEHRRLQEQSRPFR